MPRHENHCPLVTGDLDICTCGALFRSLLRPLVCEPPALDQNPTRLHDPKVADPQNVNRVPKGKILHRTHPYWGGFSVRVNEV